MRAYKGFSSDMTCHYGKGTYQYRIGETYTEKYADAHERGFHCAENPLDCLKWYGNRSDRICLVEATGDISEDGSDTKIACTKMKIIRELSRPEFVLECIKYIAKHPDIEDRRIRKECGTSSGDFVIVRGRHPKAKGNNGDVLGLLQIDGDKTPLAAAVYIVGEDGIRAGRYHSIAEATG